ncbi:MAG: SUMF1/EgtB/PvdO family nonheme iron enzyme [Planctomycetes bacterium]|nr:SUMF1/EgtB/PvdO family nonheme iron enzyme [Planctomycetota bacterium]
MGRRWLVVGILVWSFAASAWSEVAFLIREAPGERLRIETYRAWMLARDLGAQVLLRAGFDGREVPLARFRVIWHHHDGIEPPRWDEASLRALREYVAGGGRLLLSGTAAALVAPLGIDRAGTSPLTFGNDRSQSGLVPLVEGHPAFAGLDLDRGVLWFSNAAFPAFATFDPAGGAVLARTPGGEPNPLVEYRSGGGRAIACAWRLGIPHANVSAAYRENFRGLLANLLAYLEGDGTWEPPGDPRAVPLDWTPLELAIADLIETFGERYSRGAEYLRRLEDLKRRGGAIGDDLEALRREALLANPLLDFDRLLVVRRRADNLGLPYNYLGNCSLPPAGYDNRIAILSPVGPGGRLSTLYEPEGGRFAGDVDLDFDADRLLFSMPDARGRWRIWEIRADGTGLRTIPQIDEPDVDNYDACYLPDGRIIFSSTACFTGIPCVRGSAHVANLYLAGTDGRIRQLTVEQDHDWCPTVLPTGRILYLRWEYTDIPHAFSRILFHMNPDGTEQMAYYGSNSYWPNAMFYARPLPGHPTKIVAVVGGHHDVPRMGDLVIFDPARGVFEADGAVQRIPGRGRRVEPAVLDLVTAQSYPTFLHPFPLSEKYMLAACKPSADAPWGIYLVDVFDNLILLHEEPGYALLEPVPLRKSPRPPVVPDKVDLARGDAEVFLADIYVGPGLARVPRGTIKAMRVFAYQFAYQGMGAEPDSVGLDGPWDPKRILGTVPVEADGSACFRIPAYTPIALQPLDAEGKAVQLMRSWFTAMPGEVLSCIGCHENPNTAPPARPSIAATRPPSEIAPWYGPPRGFSFGREVQPVLDRFCIGCHGGEMPPDLRDGEPAPLQKNTSPHNLFARFTPSYYALRRLVRTPTKESDLHLLMPYEYHADTTRLVQMLADGHYGVRLDAEAWDRLITWIDLNAPAHGTWTEICGPERVDHQRERRRAMLVAYAGRDADPEALIPGNPDPRRAPIVPEPEEEPVAPLPSPPSVSHAFATRTIDLGGGVTMDLVEIPGSLWMGRTEVTNAQFALFDPMHDSRFESGDFIQFSQGERGWPVNEPWQPVVRVSWRRAMDFCRWLSERTGSSFTLPSEEEWEYACRAGTTTPFWYGGADADFSPFANLSDASNRSIDPFGWAGRVEALPPWRPADARFDDRYRVTAPVGLFRPNPWGLCDMHGNAAEWTRSVDRADPGKRVVRGGSWYDPPARATSSFRKAFGPDQGVFDVGFRVITAGP